MQLIISGATIIDGNGGAPLKDGTIAIDGGRIVAIGRNVNIPAGGARRIDARGKFIIPGLMNANVHLFGAITLERLARHYDDFEGVIAEAAQVVLKNGLTTVFDTWGPRRPLMAVRDKINAGELPGSRFFCAGNIIGFDGLFSPDFFAKASEVVSTAFSKRFNAMWVENVGRHLMWLSPEQVAKEIRTYISKGIDFVKYASNDHGAYPGCFLTFSPRVQQAIVEEAHRAGLTAQAHTHTVEGVQIAAEAGCELLQHVNVTGPVSMSEPLLELLAKRKTGCVVFPWTRKAMDWIEANDSDGVRNLWQAMDVNARNLIRAGATILLATDSMLLGPEVTSDPLMKKGWAAMPEDMNLVALGTGHFFWMRAMEEKEFPPMEMLKAATKNIAVAYGKDKDLGTLEQGKIADLLILDKNPLDAADNYRTINMVIKDGVVVDTGALPVKPILTKPLDAPVEEEASYVPVIKTDARFPMCPSCMSH